jgi:hypothetical protein
VQPSKGAVAAAEGLNGVVGLAFVLVCWWEFSALVTGPVVLLVAVEVSSRLPSLGPGCLGPAFAAGEVAAGEVGWPGGLQVHLCQVLHSQP